MLMATGNFWSWGGGIQLVSVDVGLCPYLRGVKLSRILFTQEERCMNTLTFTESFCHHSQQLVLLEGHLGAMILQSVPTTSAINPKRSFGFQ